MAVDGRYYEVAGPGSFGEKLMIKARNRIYDDFHRSLRPSATDTILDVGISDVLSDGANVLERLYPHPRQITACGLGNAVDFQAAFPGVRYKRIEPGAPLPFQDKSFDIATSNAVLEHVGGVDSQRRFVAEMLRVAHRVFVSVPHRFFPVEHHTAIPFAHWTDPTFRFACTLTKKHKWMDERELRLMSSARLAAVVPAGTPYRVAYTGLRLGPFSSNLYLVMGGDETGR